MHKQVISVPTVPFLVIGIYSIYIKPSTPTATAAEGATTAAKIATKCRKTVEVRAQKKIYDGIGKNKNIYYF